MHPEAVLLALRRAWLAIEPLRLPVAVMGGLALAVWQHVRATRDVDLALSLEQHELERLLDRLREAGIRRKPGSSLVHLGGQDVVPLLYEPPDTFMDVQVDLLLANGPYQRQALDRRAEANLPALDIAIDVLSCEDLILHKLLAGRLIDRYDAAALVRINRQTLDVSYLKQWSGELGLEAELSSVWLEACPGETPPR